MRMAQVVLLPALILSIHVADAQLIRSGDLPNLAEGATAAASTSATEYDGAGEFFAGKLLIGPDGVATAIREVNYGQPQTIRVASTAGFSDGDECWYQDVQPGDEVVIHAQATLSRTGAGTYRITANTPVTVEAQGEVLQRAGDDEWLKAEDSIPRGR